MHNKVVVTIDGYELTLSNLDKLLYLNSGFTKQAVIDYYIRIAPVLLPYLNNRPITLKRYPNGSLGNFFYQKQCPAHKPNWLKTAPVWSRHNNKNINFCLLNDLPSLVWAANLAALELHTSLAVAPDIKTPQTVVFDLDPGHPANILDCAQVALWLRTLFNDLRLESYPKTSGSKGLQVYIPLNTPVTYEETKNFAHNIAKLLEKKYPNRVVSKMNKSLRTGKVFVDWSQNDEHKTTVCVYSLRAKEQPTVSTPVAWDEVKTAVSENNQYKLSFTANTVLQRITLLGDIFSPVLHQKQHLPNNKKNH